MEQIKALLEEYLWHYVNASERNRVQLLDAAQFTHNLHKSLATSKSPFEVVLGRQPLTPIDVMQRDLDGSCPAAYRMAQERMEVLQEARDSMEIAVRRIEHYANRSQLKEDLSASGSFSRLHLRCGSTSPPSVPYAAWFRNMTAPSSFFTAWVGWPTG